MHSDIFTHTHTHTHIYIYDCEKFVYVKCINTGIILGLNKSNIKQLDLYILFFMYSLTWNFELEHVLPFEKYISEPLLHAEMKQLKHLKMLITATLMSVVLCLVDA